MYTSSLILLDSVISFVLFTTNIEATKKLSLLLQEINNSTHAVIIMIQLLLLALSISIPMARLCQFFNVFNLHAENWEGPGDEANLSIILCLSHKLCCETYHH